MRNSSDESVHKMGHQTMKNMQFLVRSQISETETAWLLMDYKPGRRSVDYEKELHVFWSDFVNDIFLNLVWY